MIDLFKRQMEKDMINENYCNEENCNDKPHKMYKNSYHVPCALCGLLRTYRETRDWQTQDEMSKMCGICITGLIEDLENE